LVSSALSCGTGGRYGPTSRLGGPFGPRRPSARPRAGSLSQAPVLGNDQALVEQLIGRLDDSGSRFISPTDPGQRAAIVVISGADPGDNEAVCQRLTDAGIDAALPVWRTAGLVTGGSRGAAGNQ
jgi:hypothetical protein